jgi:hypothetical protein
VPEGGGLTLSQGLMELGFFADADFIAEPLPRHDSLWTGALSDEIEDAFRRFSEVRTTVLEIAYAEGLAVEVRRGRRSGRDRREIFDDFNREMRQRYAAGLRTQLEALGDREGPEPDEP